MPSVSFNALLSGFGLGAGLIIAIGAQNAYVLRQGLLRRHVGVIVAICAAFDMLLIAAGVSGMGRLVEHHPNALAAIRYIGALFLFVYGCRAWLSAFRGGGQLRAAESADHSIWRTAATALTLSALNPHVYLDTVLLLGSIGGRLEWPDRGGFAVGAMLASCTWFCALGYGARLLDRLFARDIAWRVLDTLIGLVMFAIALSLVFAQ